MIQNRQKSDSSFTKFQRKITVSQFRSLAQKYFFQLTQIQIQKQQDDKKYQIERTQNIQDSQIQERKKEKDQYILKLFSSKLHIREEQFSLTTQWDEQVFLQAKQIQYTLIQIEKYGHNKRQIQSCYQMLKYFNTNQQLLEQKQRNQQKLNHQMQKNKQMLNLISQITRYQEQRSFMNARRVAPLYDEYWKNRVSSRQQSDKYSIAPKIKQQNRMLYTYYFNSH